MPAGSAHTPRADEGGTLYVKTAGIKYLRGT